LSLNERLGIRLSLKQAELAKKRLDKAGFFVIINNSSNGQLLIHAPKGMLDEDAKVMAKKILEEVVSKCKEKVEFT
jgi:hypothetical protein